MLHGRGGKSKNEGASRRVKCSCIPLRTLGVLPRDALCLAEDGCVRPISAIPQFLGDSAASKRDDRIICNHPIRGGVAGAVATDMRLSGLGRGGGRSRWRDLGVYRLFYRAGWGSASADGGAVAYAALPGRRSEVAVRELREKALRLLDVTCPSRGSY